MLLAAQRRLRGCSMRAGCISYRSTTVPSGGASTRARTRTHAHAHTSAAMFVVVYKPKMLPVSTTKIVARVDDRNVACVDDHNGLGIDERLASISIRRLLDSLPTYTAVSEHVRERTSKRTSKRMLRPYCTGGHIARAATLHGRPYCTTDHIAWVAILHRWP